jgi:PIN domain nuclease of toxin-antitoxin system
MSSCALMQRRLTSAATERDQCFATTVGSGRSRSKTGKISLDAIAKLVQYGRLDLDRPVTDWIESALLRPGLELLPLIPIIDVESTQLPEPFRRDPADQLIIATARVHNIPLSTADSKMLNYPHVRIAVR